MGELFMLWLEISGKCQLECTHCYAASGPHGGRGAMARDDWFRVIDDASRMGVEMVQLIGGEPTLHPDFTALVERVLDKEVAVEVYSNLVKVTPAMWELFERPGVRLATSYYSPSASEHDAITRRHRSHDLTLANIMRALQRKVPIRVGVIGVEGSQDVDGAVAELRALGIADVGVDHIRQVGRGARDAQPSFSQLCGHCADGKLAVTPSGDVYPCVFSRWLPVGDARRTSLIEIHQIADGARIDLRAAFAGRMPAMSPAPCVPNNQPPCPPMIQCGPAAQPCGPDRDGRDHR